MMTASPTFRSVHSLSSATLLQRRIGRSARPNVLLLRRVLAYIDAHPERWDNSFFVCDTPTGPVGCLAYWTVVLSGHEVASVEEKVTDGAREHVAVVAQTELRITDAEAHALFFVAWNREMVQRAYDVIAARA